MKAIEVRPIERNQISAAKRVILTVGRRLYKWEETLEEIISQFDEKGELSDIDNYESHYVKQRGLFLVITDRDEVIGTGAIRRIDDSICELKRLWLLEKYQGEGIGYRVLQELIKFSQENGYKKIRLETDNEQERAIRFYQRVGFQNIEKYNNRNSDNYMEMEI